MLRFMLLVLLAGCSPVLARSQHTRTDVHAKIEVGVIAGASYRIDVPANWNGELLLYCHGYAAAPPRFDSDARDAIADIFGPEGVAVAQSAYSAGGYALREGADDTMQLLAYFRQRFATPKRVWVSGKSLGGSIAMMLLETRSSELDGGLALCTPLGAAVAYIKALIFDPIVLFASWFPDHLPSPVAVPEDYAMSVQRATKLAKLLDTNPIAASVLRNYTTARSNHELGLMLDLDTYILGELQRRLHGNAFDNRDTVYAIAGANDGLNALVARYPADAHALQALLASYTPTGRLDRPLLAVRTAYDPLISAWSSDHYAQTVQQANRSTWFAQQHTDGVGHCELSADELKTALQELRHWRETGKRPASGRLPK